VIEVRQLTIAHRGSLALDNVTLVFQEGVVGILGPNGAGKTTLLSALATGRSPTHGSITVEGHDVATREGRQMARHLIGWLPQRFDLAGGMSTIEAVQYAAWANGVSVADSRHAAEYALQVMDLSERSHVRVRHLSGGQRQRLGLAACLAHDPKVLLLDEPTVGLDPEQRVRFRSYLRDVSAGRTVILATHLLEDVRHACDAVVVLLRGRVAFSGKPSELASLGGDQTDPHESHLERGYRSLLERSDRGLDAGGVED
jgi:ABC-2 type transport system ATP-binding protein